MTYMSSIFHIIFIIVKKAQKTEFTIPTIGNLENTVSLLVKKRERCTKSNIFKIFQTGFDCS